MEEAHFSSSAFKGKRWSIEVPLHSASYRQVKTALQYLLHTTQHFYLHKAHTTLLLLFCLTFVNISMCHVLKNTSPWENQSTDHSINEKTSHIVKWLLHNSPHGKGKNHFTDHSLCPSFQQAPMVQVKHIAVLYETNTPNQLRLYRPSLFLFPPMYLDLMLRLAAPSPTFGLVCWIMF